MEESILQSIKKLLNIDALYFAFDPDITLHINSAFSTLNQLGIGPQEGFMIEDANATWGTYLQGNLHIMSVKQYIYMKVRLAFDPPTNSFAIDAVKEQIKELEWRLNVAVETGTLLGFLDPEEVFIDGGSA